MPDSSNQPAVSGACEAGSVGGQTVGKRKPAQTMSLERTDRAGVCPAPLPHCRRHSLTYNQRPRAYRPRPLL